MKVKQIKILLEINKLNNWNCVIEILVVISTTLKNHKFLLYIKDDILSNES